jgi:hypothetical protein
MAIKFSLGTNNTHDHKIHYFLVGMSEKKMPLTLVVIKNVKYSFFVLSREWNAMEGGKSEGESKVTETATL